MAKLMRAIDMMSVWHGLSDVNAAGVIREGDLFISTGREINDRGWCMAEVVSPRLGRCWVIARKLHRDAVEVER